MRRKKLLVVTLSLLVALVSTEILVRACIAAGWLHDFDAGSHLEGLHRYADAPELVYELRPSRRVVRQGVAYATNAHGMRDAERTLEKPAGVFRIAVLGDSVAFGFRIAREHRFSEILERRLDASHPGTRHEVLNFGVIGYNASQEQVVLERKVVAFEPDVMLLAFCLNDDTGADGLRGLPRELHPRAIGPRIGSRLVSLALDRWEAMAFHLRVRWDRVDSLFRRAAELGSERHFDTLLLVFPFRFEDPSDYGYGWKHEAAVESAARVGLPALDLLPAFAAVAPERRRGLFVDDVHLSRDGMSVVADTILRDPRFRAWIARTAGPPGRAGGAAASG